MFDRPLLDSRWTWAVSKLRFRSGVARQGWRNITACRTVVLNCTSSDPFWENEARTVLTAAIAYVCYSNPAEQRPGGERIARATSKSDWSPYDLRDGSNPTIYIYIRPNEVESYLSLLRVFIGQHIRMLTGGKVPPVGSPPILFMLDELPRLRNMPPVDEALNIGRKYGLRLWMFAQSVGQLPAYDNADGMLGSCAVRIFMNPSGADGLAEKISEELGYVDSINDNSRRRLVEALISPDRPTATDRS